MLQEEYKRSEFEKQLQVKRQMSNSAEKPLMENKHNRDIELTKKEALRQQFKM